MAKPLATPIKQNRIIRCSGRFQHSGLLLQLGWMKALCSSTAQRASKSLQTSGSRHPTVMCEIEVLFNVPNFLTNGHVESTMVYDLPLLGKIVSSLGRSGQDTQQKHTCHMRNKVVSFEANFLVLWLCLV